MDAYSAPIANLIEEFEKLPGIGHKTACRLAFHILNQPEKNAREFSNAILEAKEKIQKHLSENPVITIIQVRDMFETSRKSAKPILEYMDSIKVTKKTGGESERIAY